MRVYPDSNIYLSYILDDGQSAPAEEFFSRSASCLFEIVVSNTTFEEVQRRCENRAIMLIQNHLDEFKKAGKIHIVSKTPEENERAILLNSETGGEFGQNDFIHAILAYRHSDLFVTNDFRFMKNARTIANTLSLEQFLRTLKFEP